MFIIRFAFYFTLSFAILCIPIGNDRQLFDKLVSFVSPYARKAVKTTKQKLSSTKKYSKKLYSNSEPKKLDDQEDEVKSKMSSTQRKKKEIKKENKDSEDLYTEEEQERLRRVLSEE